MDLITKCPVERLPGFLHACIDEELNVLRADINKFPNFWSLEEWLTVKSTTKTIFNEALKNNWTSDQLINELKDIPAKYQNAFADTLEVRKSDLLEKLISDTNKIGTFALKDFDWEVKLSLASDKLASMHEPLFGLDLRVQNNSGDAKRLALELNKTELNQIIASFESINKVLLKLNA